MNIKIFGNSEYCETIHDYLLSGSINELVSDLTITKDSGSTPTTNSDDLVIINGTDSTMLDYYENNLSGSCATVIANTRENYDELWKNYNFADLIFTKQYPNDYLTNKIVIYKSSYDGN